MPVDIKYNRASLLLQLILITSCFLSCRYSFFVPKKDVLIIKKGIIILLNTETSVFVEHKNLNDFYSNDDLFDKEELKNGFYFHINDFKNDCIGYFDAIDTLCTSPIMINSNGVENRLSRKDRMLKIVPVSIHYRELNVEKKSSKLISDFKFNLDENEYNIRLSNTYSKHIKIESFTPIIKDLGSVL